MRKFFLCVFIPTCILVCVVLITSVQRGYASGTKKQSKVIREQPTQDLRSFQVAAVKVKYGEAPVPPRKPLGPPVGIDNFFRPKDAWTVHLQIINNNQSQKSFELNFEKIRLTDTNKKTWAPDIYELQRYIHAFSKMDPNVSTQIAFTSSNIIGQVVKKSRSSSPSLATHVEQNGPVYIFTLPANESLIVPLIFDAPPNITPNMINIPNMKPITIIHD